MFNNLFRYFAPVLLSMAIFILSGCGPSGTANGTGAVAAKLVWGAGKATDKAVGAVPATVANVKVAISGPAITTAIQQTFSSSRGGGTISNVPAGTGLTVTATALDASGTSVYQGSVGNVTVLAGQTTDVVTVIMLPFTGTAVSSGTLQPGTAAKLGITDSTSSAALNFNFPANAVSLSTPVTVSPVASSALPAPLAKAVAFTPNSANVYAAAFSIAATGITAFNVPIPLSGSVASTFTAGTALNVAIFKNNSWVDVSTVTVGASGAITQSLVSTSLPGITTPGTYLIYQPAPGSSTAVSNLGVVLIADDGSGIGTTFANGLQVINIFDVNGNVLATPTIKTLTYTGAGDIDGQALTPDGSQGIIVDGGNTIRFFKNVQTGVPVASTTTVDVSLFGGDGDSVAIMPNGDEAVVSADSSTQLLVVSGITSGLPKSAEVITIPSSRDGVVISNDGKVLLSRGFGGITVFSIASITPKTGSLGGTISHSFTNLANLTTGPFPTNGDGRNGLASSPVDSSRAVVIGSGSIAPLSGLTTTPAVGTAVTIKGATSVYSVSITPDGKKAVVGTNSGIALFTGVDTGTLVQVGTTTYAPTFTVGTSTVTLTNVPTLGITLDGNYVVVAGSTSSFGGSSGTLLVIPFDSTKASGFGAVAGQLNGIAVPGNDQMVIH